MGKADDDLRQWLVETRRDLHRHPETAYTEKRTTDKIIAILSELGVEVRPFEDITGAVGLVSGKRSGPTIALRADIDALPITELNDVPYKSVHDGVMHACGHDAHTAIMLGVAKKIISTGLMEKAAGCVKFLFQPAEEGGAGAKAMIERGVLETPYVDRIIAGHMAPDIPVGSVGIFKELSHASADRFNLEIIGRGGHGARPEDCRDPIVAGAAFVQQIQTIVSRNIKASHAAVVTVGKFSAGTIGNVIPESAKLRGTIRALRAEVRDVLIERLQQITEGIATTYGVECRFNLKTGYPNVINDSEVAASLQRASSAVLGSDKVSYFEPTMGAEDFSFFTQKRPAAIMRLGCANPEKNLNANLHSAYFDIDEDVLQIGVDIFYRAVCDYLAPS